MVDLMMGGERTFFGKPNKPQKPSKPTPLRTRHHSKPRQGVMRTITGSAITGILLLQVRVSLGTFLHRKHHPQGRTHVSITSSQYLTSEDDKEPLAWLTSRLGLDPDQAASMATTHPPLLGYDIERNLEPTISFYEEAMGGDATSLLCESPALLEYNVRKRLIPRLSLVKKSLEGPLDAPSVKAIATKTDSRFDEWLCELQGGKRSTNASFNDTSIPEDIPRTPPCFMVLSNLQSGGNIGNILRSASIFGCQECLVVGQKRYRLTGEHNSRHNLPRRHFWSHADAKEYLHAKGIRVYGIEIMAGASPLMRYNPDTGVVQFPFDRQCKGAAFVMGNEGDGLSIKQREICDEFIFIPQTRGATSRSGGGSASLNVACAATVVLQAYATWACYPDAEFEGEKFMS